MGLLFSNSYVPKNLYLPILLHFFHLIFSLPQPRFHKPYLQSKTFLNIRAVLGIAVFSSNAVLMIGPSFSMQFFGFFDMLPSSPTITRMTLMLLMSHILLIYLFSSWYISIFSFYFLLTLMSPGIAISHMVQLLSLILTTTISGFFTLISLSDWIITSH